VEISSSKKLSDDRQPDRTAPTRADLVQT